MFSDTRAFCWAVVMVVCGGVWSRGRPRALSPNKNNRPRASDGASATPWAVGLANFLFNGLWQIVRARDLCVLCGFIPCSEGGGCVVFPWEYRFFLS